MGSGIIWAALVGIWAAYFIPRWLRRHEELSEARSVERFERAMRTLSRKESLPDQRYVVMPPRPAEAVAGSRPRRQGLRTTSSVTVRRRRVLAGLLLTLLAVSIATPLSPLPAWSPLVTVGLVVAWLVHCRLQARTRTAVQQQRRDLRRRGRSRLLRFQSLERLMAVRRELAEERAVEQVRWQEAEEAFRREQEAEEERRRAEAEGWTPVPVPLPTYVTKPPAPRPAPPIDLTRPGDWTATQTEWTAPSAQTVSSAQSGPSAAVPAQGEPAHGNAMSALLDDAAEADDELDAIIHRRAVND